MSVKVGFSKSAVRELGKLDRSTQELILKKIRLLYSDPFPPKSQKLTELPGYRLRAGDYRILYLFQPKKKKFTIYKIAHRSEVYR